MCRKMGVSEATFTTERKSLAGWCDTIAPSTQLEDENQRLRRLVADLSLDKEMILDVIGKNSVVRPETGNGGLQLDAHRIALRRGCF